MDETVEKLKQSIEAAKQLKTQLERQIGDLSKLIKSAEAVTEKSDKGPQHEAKPG